MNTVYNEFGYNEQPAWLSRLLSIKITDNAVKTFGYNEQPAYDEQYHLHRFTRCLRVPVYLPWQQWGDQWPSLPSE